MTRRSLIFLAVASAGGLAGGVAHGQQPAPLLQLADQSFTETFNRLGISTGVKGAPGAPGDKMRVLAGLHLGKANGRFDVTSIRVALKPDIADTAYCVRIATSDSRYQAFNNYRKSAERNAVPLVQTQSRYGKDLTAYDAAKVPVRVVGAAPCSNETSGKLVPAIPPGAKDQSALVAYLNIVGDRPSVKLVADEGAPVAGVCRHVGDAEAILYSDVCEVPLGVLGARRPTALHVSFTDDDTGSRVELAFPILWARP